MKEVLFTEKFEARRLVVDEFSKWATLEETMWRQKRREVWLMDGDKTQTFIKWPMHVEEETSWSNSE